MGQQLSIHGRDKNGKESGSKYNPAPIQSELSDSPRAIRRRANGRGKGDSPGVVKAKK